MTAPTPDPAAVAPIELEDTFADASLEMDETGGKHRVALALQNQVSANTSAIASNTSGLSATQADLTAHKGAGGTAHAAATTSAAGFMSAADKSKLDGLTGSSLLQSELWCPPATPHPRDIEFASVTLPADLVWANASMAPITPDNGVPLTTLTLPATLPRYKVHTQRRASHLQWQTPYDGAMRYIYAPWNAPANASAWCRAHFLKYASQAGTMTNTQLNDIGLRWCLFADNAGKPDSNNYVYLELHTENNGNPNVVLFRIGRVLGGTDTLYPTSANTYFQPNAYSVQQYLGIRKTGTNYQFFVSEGSEGGLSMQDAATGATPGNVGVPFTPTIKYAGMRFVQTNSPPGIYTIFSCDFWRFADTDDVLPW